jgi:chromosome partitioning protein
MMKTLAIISHKGGAGKTSSAVMIAEEFARRGLRTVLVDADRQKGAGLILGIEQVTGNVQQTRNPKLRYFCSSGLPLRELGARSGELANLFDVAVVDTPSLDDPLARGWIQLSSDVLMTLPVEPVSMKTLESADTILDTIYRLNHEINFAGTLPTMFDESDSTQRTLMLELRSRRPEGLLSPAIPHDPGMAHRAEQKAERRTEASEATRQAYSAAADFLMHEMQITAPQSASASNYTPQRKPGVPAPAGPVAAGGMPASVAARRPPALAWAAIAVAVLVLVGLLLGMLMRPAHAASETNGRQRGALAAPEFGAAGLAFTAKLG